MRGRLIQKVLEGFPALPRADRRLAFLLIAIAMIGVSVWVYSTGGIKYVYSHSMYIPILLAGFTFGSRGGFLAGLAGGILLGPVMPIDVASGEKQATIQWVYRTGFFVLIGLLNGGGVEIINERKRRIDWLAHNDFFSELPNRTSLVEALERVAEREPETFLFFVFASNLYEVTAAFGINAGDAIIREMAERFRAELPPPVSIFHHHPEQLGIVLSARNIDQFDECLERISRLMREPFNCGNALVHVEPQIGGVRPEMLVGPPDALFRRAKLAINEARLRELEIQTYSVQLERSVQQNLRILGLLKQAIEEDELCLHYQPKVSLGDGRLTGVEALVRWNSPTMGEIQPDAFIPQAERSTLIHPLTNWVLNAALNDLARWDKLGVITKVSVNVSTRNLSHASFYEGVMSSLDHVEISADRLELEVTEGTLIQDPAAVRELLVHFAESKIAISIDDFGAGYSSLRYLNQLPASALKIDKTFIRTLRRNSEEAKIVNAAIRLAHAVGMKVVGEGVESQESLDILREMGCDIAQGFHIGRPMPGNQLLDWIRRTQDASLPDFGPRN